MFVDEVKKELNSHIIPFWMSLKDDVNGGYYGYMDYNLNLFVEASKGVILNSRITWFFSNSYIRIKNEKLLACARHGYEFLRDKCIDKKNGGVYWEMDYKGNPIDTTKHTYNQAFAIYALCAYYEASGEKEALDLAMNIYDLIEEKCTDEYGYLEAFTIDFKPESNEKLSENGVMAEKTMNTLLHVLEGYTQLYKVSQSEKVKKSIYWILDIFENKVYNPALKRQEVFFDKTYNSIIDLHSYGHDIETAWLVDRTLEILEDSEIENRLNEITKELTEQTYKVAFNGKSFANECEKGKVDGNSVWWVQAEAVVGFINGWQKTGNVKYLDAAMALWDYIKEKLIDKREGSEWYWLLDEEGNPVEGKPIVEPWKCPYHNGRMCFEVMDRFKEGKGECIDA